MPLQAPEQAVANALKQDAAVALVVGDRVYPVLAPSTAAIPFVTWRRQSVSRQQTLSGPMGMPTVVLAIDCYALTYEAVRDLADKIRRVLDGWGEQKLGIDIRHVSLDGESDGFVQLAGGDAPPVYSVTLTFSILWKET
jgi:hypothetical protein